MEWVLAYAFVKVVPYPVEAAIEGTIVGLAAGYYEEALAYTSKVKADTKIVVRKMGLRRIRALRKKHELPEYSVCRASQLVNASCNLELFVS